ncbi:hypothetical protein ACHAPT_007256 [Fusarium lateritium]
MNPEAQVFDFEIHSRLITTQQLVRRLEGLLPPDTFSVEMKHNVYHIRVDTSQHAQTEEPETMAESRLDCRTPS